MWQRTCVGFLICSVTLILVGCGSGVKGPTGTVTGSVTVKGAAAPAGTNVLFQSNDGYSAGGTVDAAGKYTLKSNGSSYIPAATYLVQVSPPPAPPAPPMDPAKVATGGSAPALPPPFPAKYGSTATSGFQFKIEPKENKIDLDLKD
jgi:hypothetical protein